MDLGASVNLLPTTVYQQFQIGELKLTPVILQLADRSVRTPRELVEDVLVRIDTCYFSVDFLILDMEPAQQLTQTPIILGRPFLATAKANIDCAKGTIDISVGDQKISLNIFQASQHMRDNEDCFTIDVIDSLVEESCSLNQIEDFGELRGCE